MRNGRKITLGLVKNFTNVFILTYSKKPQSVCSKPVYGLVFFVCHQKFDHMRISFPATPEMEENMKKFAMSRRSFLQSAGLAATALAVSPAPLFRVAQAAEAGGKKEIRYTYCDNCNGVPFCGIKFETTDGVVTNVENWGDGYPAGPICSKGYATMQRQHNPNRLLYPMVRTAPKGAKDPKFVRITWDEAYKRIAKALTEIKRKHGPDKVIFYCGDPKEPRAGTRRLASVYGSINFGTESSINCSSAQMMANIVTAGTFILNTGAPAPGTKCCLIWGTNFSYSNAPTLKKALAVKESGCKFIVVDPRATATAGALADLHLQPRTGVTAALAAGLAHVIIKEGLHDKEFCEKWIHGWDEYRSYVSQFTPEKTAEITWVPADKIVEAARMFATNKPSQILNSTQSTIHDRNAVNNHRGIVMLYAITGQRPPFEGKRPGLPTPPGYVFWPFTDDKFTRYDLVKDKYGTQRFDVPYFPAWAEYTTHIMLNKLPEYVDKHNCRAFLGWGFNVMIWSQTQEFEAALAKMDFTMATDYFYRPHTHDFLDMVLPAATNFERYAPFMVFGRKVYGRTPITPLGQAREDWQIAMEIGTALGEGQECFNGDPVKACDEILGWWGLSYKQLQDNIAKGVMAETPYPPNPSKELGFPTPTGKIEAISTRLTKYNYPGLPEYKEPYQPSKEYPLLIISGTRRPHITHSKTREQTPWLLELESLPYCDINPADAADRGLKQGDPIVLSSQWGKIDCYANLTNILPKGIVGMMHGWVNANVNLLMPRAYDPVSGYPSLKEIAVQVSRKQA